MLLAGKARHYADKEKRIDEAVIQRQITDGLSGLDNKQRVISLTNLMDVISKAYPACKPDEETAKMLQDMRDAEENTDEDVAKLLGMIAERLPKAGTLLGRATISGLERHLHQLNGEALEKALDDSDSFTDAYVAARYIMQQRGHLSANMAELPASVLGAAAADIEGSRLISLYSRGKIGLEVLSKKLSSLFTSLFTFVSEHIVSFFAQVLFYTESAGVSIALAAVLLEILTVPMYAEGLIIIAAVALGTFLTDKLFTIEEWEEVVTSVCSVFEEIWASIKKVWHNIVGSDLDQLMDEADDAQAESEDVESAQEAEAQTEEADESIDEEEDEDEDEDEEDEEEDNDVLV